MGSLFLPRNRSSAITNILVPFIAPKGILCDDVLEADSFKCTFKTA